MTTWLQVAVSIPLHTDQMNDHLIITHARPITNKITHSIEKKKKHNDSSQFDLMGPFLTCYISTTKITNSNKKVFQIQLNTFYFFMQV